MYISTRRMFFIGSKRIPMKHAIELMGGRESYYHIIHECKQHLWDAPSYCTQINTAEGVLKVMVQRDVRSRICGKTIV